MRETKTALARRVLELARKLDAATSNVVPYTTDIDLKAGHTLMIRVPRLFFPSAAPATARKAPPNAISSPRGHFAELAIGSDGR